MTWFIFSLLSISALALAELTQQHIVHFKGKFDERTSGTLTFLVQAIFTIPIILVLGLYQDFFKIFDPNILPYFILVSLVASTAMIFYLRSFKVQNISISTMFASISVIVSTTLGIIFFNETFYLYKMLGIALVLTAIISLNLKNLLLEKNNFYGLIAGMLFGISYTLDKKIITADIHPIIYIFWAFIGIAFFGFLFGVKTVTKSIKASNLHDYIPVLFSGFGYFLYNFFTFAAYSVGGEVGRIDTINNSQVFLIILAEYFILKNKEGIFRKIITSLIAFTGVAILGLL